MTHPVPAVVVGGGVNGLANARSLGRAGVRVVLAHTDPAEPMVRTRYAERVRFSTLTRVPVAGRDVIDELLALADRLAARPVLVLTREETVTFVSEARARLGERYRFVMPPHETMLDLLDKTRFQARAEALGFPVPRSVSLAGPADLDRAAALTYPCIVKPTTKHPDWGRHFKKAYRPESFAELARLYREIAPVVPDVIVQEWIVGGDADVFFCLQYRDGEGRTLASFTGRKIRQWPPAVGGTASCMPAAEAAPELEALTTRFFDAVGFVGIGSMEFKRDARFGSYSMIEPTVGRTDYQEEVAALNGVNLPLVAYASLCGAPPPAPASTGRPRLWRDRVNDARSLSVQPDAIDPPEARGLEVVDTVWRYDDPGPWIAQWRRRIAGRLGRLLGAGRSQAPSST